MGCLSLSFSYSLSHFFYLSLFPTILQSVIHFFDLKHSFSLLLSLSLSLFNFLTLTLPLFFLTYPKAKFPLHLWRPFLTD